MSSRPSGRKYTAFEDEVIKTIGVKYDDKVIAKVLGRTKNSIASRRLLMGIRKVPEYNKTPELLSFIKTHKRMGNPSNYWKDEKEIEQSLDPQYKIEDLKGWEKEQLNQQP